ncbi:MAG: Holliday junction branch migration protein RuvA [Clostridia bacterium]|nr:Holliday junction branch migration protein RuvA [Clostridia bacterium]
MIYSVTGNVVDFDANIVCVDVNGVAFRCMTTLTTSQKCASMGMKVTLYTYLNVREDAMELFGFYDKTEMDCFKMLITVNGVGPKMGLAILSELTPDKIALSIAAGDHKALTKANGVGPKLAQRICMELKDKVGKAFAGVDTSVDLSAVSSTLTNTNSAEAIAALEMLGYSQSDASVVVSKIDPSLPVEDIIKQALKMLALG